MRRTPQIASPDNPAAARADPPRNQYGAAGSLLVLLVWVYYSAVVFYTSAVLVAATLPASPVLAAAPAGDARGPGLSTP